MEQIPSVADFAGRGKLVAEMQGVPTNFHHAEWDQPHPERTRAIMKAHPEVRALFGRNPYTALICFSVVALQTAIAYGMGRLGWSYWWLMLIPIFISSIAGNMRKGRGRNG